MAILRTLFDDVAEHYIPFLQGELYDHAYRLVSVFRHASNPLAVFQRILDRLQKRLLLLVEHL